MVVTELLRLRIKVLLAVQVIEAEMLRAAAAAAGLAELAETVVVVLLVMAAMVNCQLLQVRLA
jgi:hypothetical protein